MAGHDAATRQLVEPQTPQKKQVVATKRRAAVSGFHFRAQIIVGDPRYLASFMHAKLPCEI